MLDTPKWRGERGELGHSPRPQSRGYCPLHPRFSVHMGQTTQPDSSRSRKCWIRRNGEGRGGNWGTAPDPSQGATAPCIPAFPFTWVRPLSQIAPEVENVGYAEMARGDGGTGAQPQTPVKGLLPLASPLFRSHGSDHSAR